MLVVLLALGCASEAPADGGGSPDAGAEDLGGDAQPDATDLDAGAVSPVTLRIVDAARAALTGDLVVSTAESTRRLVGSEVTLTSEELRSGVDVYVAADAHMPTGIAGFSATDFAILPEVDGDPAVVMVPEWISDPLELQVIREGLVETVPLGGGGGRSLPGFGNLRVDRQGLTGLILDAAQIEVGSRAGDCPYLYPINDPAALPSSLDLRFVADDPTVVPFECTVERITLQPSRTAPVLTAIVSWQRRRPLAFGRSGTYDPVINIGSPDEMRPSEAFDVELTLRAEELPRRDHPAVQLPRVARLDVNFEGAGRRRVGSAASLAALGDPVLLPAEVPTPERIVYEAPPGELLDGTLYAVSGFGDAALAVAPSQRDPVVLTFGFVGVLVAPGAGLPLARVANALGELVDPEQIVGNRPSFGILAETCPRLAFEPVPYCAEDGVFLEPDLPREPGSSLLIASVPADLL